MADGCHSDELKIKSEKQSAYHNPVAMPPNATSYMPILEV